METVEVRTKSKTYEVVIGKGLRHSLGNRLEDVLKVPSSAYFIITDDNVAEHYLDDVVASFSKSTRVYSAVIPSGEASKSFAMYEELITKALSYGLDRKAVIIALGGGVVGDIAGFAAATYMRGIRFVQVPTTLLAHDSSVGGKVAINHALGKNMVGSFHQPEAVFYDIETLYTMPRHEWRSGFAEVIKHGFISDEAFLRWLEREVTSFDGIEAKELATMLKRSISVKAEIVSQDEREAGVRAHLNFGHTLAHAIETELGYGAITHGEAVAIGMLFALRVSEEHFDIDLDVPRYEKWFQQLGYQTRIPKKLAIDRLLKTMSKDKKAQSGIIRMVVLKKIGEATVVEVSKPMIESLLAERLEVETIG